MCRSYDAGECKEEGCTKRITCQDNDGVCNDHDPWLNAYDEEEWDEISETIVVAGNWENTIIDWGIPAPKCVCKHVEAHHTKVKYVNDHNTLRGPDACSWEGCGCPFFVAA